MSSREGKLASGVRVSTQTPKIASNAEQRCRHVGGQPARERRGREVSDVAAGAAHRRGALGRVGDAMGDVDDPEHAEGDAEPADDEPAAGAGLGGVADEPPGQQDEQGRQPRCSRPDGAAQHVGDDATGRTARRPPDGRCRHHREREDGQAEPVAAGGGFELEFAGAAADGPHRSTEAAGDAQPDTADQPVDGADQDDE